MFERKAEGLSRTTVLICVHFIELVPLMKTEWDSFNFAIFCGYCILHYCTHTVVAAVYSHFTTIKLGLFSKGQRSNCGQFQILILIHMFIHLSISHYRIHIFIYKPSLLGYSGNTDLLKCQYQLIAYLLTYTLDPGKYWLETGGAVKRG